MIAGVGKKSRLKYASSRCAFRFDFILSCTDMLNIREDLETMKVTCRFHTVSPPDYPLPKPMAQDFAPNGCYIGDSHIGNRPFAVAMLQLASKQNIKTRMQEIAISEAKCKETVTKVKENDIRCRSVLTEFDKAFGKRVESKVANFTGRLYSDQF